ncbi:MAG: HU family DNA-binding protein [Methanobacteriota archaeon]
MSDLADHVAKKTKLKKSQAREAIKAMFDGVGNGLKRAGRVSITGIGSFVKTVKPAQKGGKEATNPFTREKYITKAKPASAKVKFRPSKGFKGMIGK